MLFKKRIPKTKKSDLFPMEKKVLDFVIEQLEAPKASALVEQIKLLPLKKRITYPKSHVTEFYPQNFGDVPEKFRFGRTEEFKLASVKITQGNKEYYCQCNFVLGQLFDLSIRPVPEKLDFKSKNWELKDITIESNVNKN